jgi:thymidylate kinase
LDQISTYLLRARLPAALGRVVVCDRFVYDTAVEMAQSLPPDDEWGRRAIRAMLALTPPPDLGYVLDVPPGVARERRPEEGLPGDLDDTRGRYLRVADESGLPLVPNVGSFADVNDALVRDVITRYMAGYETWLNGLFIANPSQRNEPDPIWMGGGAA